MTGQDLITGALRLLGAIANGESLTSGEASDGLSALNDMIDSWSTEQLLIYSVVREVFSLNPAKQTYTMGTGADFSTTRPTAIENALIQIAANTPAIELPMKILNKDQYAGIILKASTSTFPLYLYVDGSYPNQNLSVWPVPTDTTNNIVLYSRKQLTQVASLSTTLSFPPGYQRALRYNLAIELAPEYAIPIPEGVLAIAVESKANIKRMNTKPILLQVDKALQAKPAVWNWMTGEPT